MSYPLSFLFPCRTPMPNPLPKLLQLPRSTASIQSKTRSQNARRQIESNSKLIHYPLQAQSLLSSTRKGSYLCFYSTFAYIHNSGRTPRLLSNIFALHKPKEPSHPSLSYSPSTSLFFCVSTQCVETSHFTFYLQEQSVTFEVSVTKKKKKNQAQFQKKNFELESIF